MDPVMKDVCSRRSWVFGNEDTEVSVTEQGGHMAPVTFRRNGKPIAPYYVNPWHAEGLEIDDPVLSVLRGDFFCFPFGADNAYKKENHPLHGETATSKWSFKAFGDNHGLTELVLEMRTKIRPGRVTKLIRLVSGHDAVYVSHVLEGYAGRMTMGHHATLAPRSEGGDMLVSLSPVRFGITSPHPTGKARDGEYYSLLPGRTFTSIEKVPTIWKDEPWADLSVFPRRKGFVDVVQVYAKSRGEPGWSCAVFPDEGFLWFALKDVSVLPSTVLWMENRGRHQSPWNGRNCCIGIEEVCGYSALGLRESARPNPVNEKGIPTTTVLSPTRPTVVNYVQGVARIPRGFDAVKNVTFGKDEVGFVSKSGKTARAAVRHSFVFTGILDR